ncbi:MAG: hypothetical protein PWQ55_1160 [Chloroflexota bacterium]|nr:hypothetical protein [Chloroflexota bacterium]
MQRMLKSMTENKRRLVRGWLLLVILQSLLAITAIVRIPVDPKNVTGLGLTRGRLVLIGLIGLLDCLAAVSLVYYEAIKARLVRLLGAERLRIILQTTALLLMLVFWISLWLPPYRLGTLFEEYERMRPFLLWLGASGLELFAVLRIFRLGREDRPAPDAVQPAERSQGRSIFIILLTTAALAGLYLYLHAKVPFNSGIIAPAPAPITPLQLFGLWVVSVVFYRLQQRYRFISRPLFIAICVVLLYGLSCGLALAAPLACKGDMVGIYPPNFTCYPDINDAVYNVGSLYIHYGEGVFNQWFTDKPLYMLFLAGCQWLGGMQIGREMVVQVLCLSLLPVLVFLFVRRLAGFPGALLAALLLIVRQVNAIRLYSKLGGVNVRIAATEVFTALLLVCTAWFLNKWFRKPAKAVFPLGSGIFLGLAILARFNAALIVPVILLAGAVYYRKAKGLGLRKLAVFSAGLALVLSPWFLLYPALNPDLQNPYVQKIQNVFWDRSAAPISAKVDEKLPAVRLIDDRYGERSDALQISPESPSSSPASSTQMGLPQQVMLHFSNNVLTAFFSLPVNSTFLDADTLTEQAFWYRDNQPIWHNVFTPENLAFWCLSVALFAWGVQRSWRRWGTGGLAPLLVLVGYLLGDALALTSGGRYLEPVLWIVILYYAVGLTSLSAFVLDKLGFDRQMAAARTVERESRFDRSLQTLRSAIEKPAVHYSGLGLLVLVAISLAFLQYLPDRLPAETSPQATQSAYEYLSGTVDPSAWEGFLQSEHSIVAAGALYYPQYYSQSRFSLARGSDVFEALVLGQDHVYMSYLWNRVPQTLTDGSRVLVVGCVLKEGELWGMQRRISQTYALIQLDNEQQIYVDPQAAWACP